MRKYIVTRMVHLLIVVFIISIVAFTLVHLIPGDPVYTMLGTEISKERHDQVWIEMGLDKPLVVQYLNWIGNIFKGNLGYSYSYRMSISELIMDKLPVTFYLGLISAVISVVLGVVLGVFTAVNRGKWQDNVLTVVANVGLAAPKFWLGVILVYIFAIQLGVLSTYGFEYPWVDFSKSIKTTILPIVCMSVSGISSYTRQTRSSMLEVISQDYIRTARAKGLKEGVIIRKHALKNALIPILTLVAVTLRNTIAGSSVIESVFNINGMGYLLVRAINTRDYQVVQSILLFMGIFTCICNILVDLAYACVDPRVRLQ